LKDRRVRSVGASDEADAPRAATSGGTQRELNATMTQSAPKRQGRDAVATSAAAAQRPVAAASGREWFPPTAIAVLMVSVFLPPELQFYAGPIRLDPPRVVLLFATIPALIDVVGGAAGGWRRWDTYMLLWGLWAVISLAVVHDAERALKFGASYVLEGFGAYVVARRHIADADAFTRTARFAVVLVALYAIPNAVEAATSFNLVRTMASGSPFWSGMGRMGLHRSYGAFPHPILNGVVCGSVLAFAWYQLWRRRPTWIFGSFLAALVVVASLASVSSGAIVAVAVPILLFAWERYSRRMRNRWIVMFALLIAGYVAVDFYSNRKGYEVFISYLTLDPYTAVGRVIVYEGGTKAIVENPVFGIGFNSWEHPSWVSDSIDAFWLCVAVQHGLPSFLGLIGGVASIYFAVVRAVRRDARLRLYGHAWGLALAGISTAGLTVHYWSSSMVWLALLIGAAVWIANLKPPARSAAPVPRA
jgi:O-antigen ligase